MIQARVLVPRKNYVHVLKLWLFDGPSERRPLDQDMGRAELARALGLVGLNAHAAVFEVKDLSDIGLTGYLLDGHGVEKSMIEPDLDALDYASGWVAVIPSSAIPQGVEEIELPDEIDLIGSYRETKTDWSAPPPITTSTVPTPDLTGSERKPMSQARLSGMVATIVLIFLIIFVVLFVWIGS